MISSPSLLVLAQVLGAVAFAGPQVEPLRVTTRVGPGPSYYVGQAIELIVEAEGATATPAFEAPRTNLADILALKLDEGRPSVARFLVIPKGAGPLVIPPFRARLGDRAAGSRPTRIAVANVPAEGRSPAFLGGIGSFSVEAGAEPSRLRTGQTFEYRIRIVGPAACGSVRPPDLSEWLKLTPSFRIETLSDVFEDADSPTRTFRYRLRPTKPGRLSLPPVSIAAFDPKVRRYQTRATPSVPVEVEELSRFDAGKFAYGPAGRPSQASRWWGWTLGLSLGLFAISGLGLWFLSWRDRDGGRVDPRAVALELSRGLASGPAGEVEAARAISEALTSYLQRVDGRSPGVLTPPEARSGFERITGDRELARSAEELVRRCDRARYGRIEGDGAGRIAQAREFFEGVAGVLSGKK